MLVRTIQGHDLSTFGDRIELDQGTYRDYPKYLQAQRKLYDLIDEDQVIWCEYVDSPLELAGPPDRYLHVIELDARDIVAVVVTLVWCHILGYGSRFIPHEDLRLLRREADNCGEANREEALNRLIDKFLKANLPPDLWSGVTREEKKTKKTNDELLVKFPLEFSQIIRVTPIPSET